MEWNWIGFLASLNFLYLPYFTPLVKYNKHFYSIFKKIALLTASILEKKNTINM